MKSVRYTREASRALRRMPVPVAQRIEQKVAAYAADPASQANNVRALKGSAGLIRLRVGDWRVIMRETEVLFVLQVVPRGGAY